MWDDFNAKCQIILKKFNFVSEKSKIFWKNQNFMGNETKIMCYETWNMLETGTLIK